MSNFGVINHQGKNYNLITDAEYTGRCLPFKGSFELSSIAICDGKQYVLYWIFDEIEGAELDQYDYRSVNRVIPL